MIAVIVGDLGHADRMCDAVTGCNKTVVVRTFLGFTYFRNQSDIFCALSFHQMTNLLK